MIATQRTIVLNKPFDVVCRFTPPANAKPGQLTLAAFVDLADVYPLGRLDRDSEGLLLLSTDGSLQHRLLDPAHAHPRVYLAQVEGTPDASAFRKLRDGSVVLDGRPCHLAQARPITEPHLWERIPPIRFRAAVPTAWIELTLTEGRNRQVRRMTAAVGHPTLRLVRTEVAGIMLAGLAPGAWRELAAGELARLRPARPPRF